MSAGPVAPPKKDFPAGNPFFIAVIDSERSTYADEHR